MVVDWDSENKEEDDSKSNKGFNEQEREKDQSKDSNDLQNQESSENEESSTESDGVKTHKKHKKLLNLPLNLQILIVWNR